MMETTRYALLNLSFYLEQSCFRYLNQNYKIVTWLCIRRIIILFNKHYKVDSRLLEVQREKIFELLKISSYRINVKFYGYLKDNCIYSSYREFRVI